MVAAGALLLPGSFALAQEGEGPEYAPTPAPSPRMQATDPEPRGNLARWVLPDDFPTDALRDEVDGTVGFTVTVDPYGAVSSCAIHQSSGREDFDEATCRLVSARARFRPAQDAQGNPVEGTYSNNVRWVHVGDPGPPTAGTVTYSYVLEKDGRKTGCKVTRVKGAIAEDLKVGENYCGTRSAVDPYLDDNFEPMRIQVTTTETVTIEPAEEKP